MGGWGEGERGRGGEMEIKNPSWKVLGEENLHPKLSAKSVLESFGGRESTPQTFRKIQNFIDPLRLVAAVGDPMQVAVAGMAIAASRYGGVLLAGGTQMLAVFALASAIAQSYNLYWQPEEIVVGTTRWVTEDSSGGTVELAQLIGTKGITPSLLATGLCFDNSRYAQLKAYEQGFVKEGMGAGGACIAAYLRENWQQTQFISSIEAQLDCYWQG